MDFKTEKFRKFIASCIDKMGDIINDETLNYTNVMYNSAKQESGVPVEPWYHYYTWTQIQEDIFKKWFIENYCKKFQQNKRKGPFSGEAVFNTFNSQYGLRLVGEPIEIDVKE